MPNALGKQLASKLPVGLHPGVQPVAHQHLHAENLAGSIRKPYPPIHMHRILEKDMDHGKHELWQRCVI